MNSHGGWVGGELFVTFCYNPKSRKLTQPKQNEPGIVQKSHQRRRTAHTAERGGGRSFWQNQPCSFEPQATAIEASVPWERKANRAPTSSSFLVCWLRGMVSWYGEVTPSSHQKRHVFPYLHCRRFVFSGKQKNILKIVLFKFLHVLI